ncbi:MAG: serine/threonine protein kinase [bacterium]|nr:serine/threonine protein kinase [bacterium]
MIAYRDNCDPKTLARVLDDSLDLEEQYRLTEHLEKCQRCRDQLESLAAEPRWWEDTKELLADAEHSQWDADDCFSFLGASAGESGSEPLGATAGSRFAPRGRPQDASNTAGLDASLQLEEHWVLHLLDPSQHQDAIGEIDSIPVHSVVGQGGMGVVLKAHDPHLHRFLAIKLLSPMLAGSGAARQRFLREAQAAAAVVHPNIVPIYAVAADRKLPYLVMPFVGGGNLQQYLTEQGPLPLDRVLSIGLQVAEGLSAAHHQGIVHRDIKPANLMLDEGGFRVMLTDFGLARALDDATLTGSGMLAGTPQFMSPEQALGKHVDHRSDIYSLGAVLYALSTGRPPIRGESTLEILQRFGTEAPKPIIEINEAYPSWFQRLVEQMMAKRLEERLATADEAAALLRQSLAHVRSPHEAPLPQALQPATRSHRWLQLAKSKTVLSWGLTALTCLLLLVGWSLRNRRLDPVQAPVPNESVSSATAADDRSAQINHDSTNPASTHTGPANSQSETEWETPEVDAILWESEQELMQLKVELGSQATISEAEIFAPPATTYSPPKGQENRND